MDDITNGGHNLASSHPISTFSHHITYPNSNNAPAKQIVDIANVKPRIRSTSIALFMAPLPNRLVDFYLIVLKCNDVIN